MQIDIPTTAAAAMTGELLSVVMPFQLSFDRPLSKLLTTHFNTKTKGILLAEAEQNPYFWQSSFANRQDVLIFLHGITLKSKRLKDRRTINSARNTKCFKNDQQNRNMIIPLVKIECT